MDRRIATAVAGSGGQAAAGSAAAGAVTSRDLATERRDQQPGDRDPPGPGVAPGMQCNARTVGARRYAAGYDRVSGDLGAGVVCVTEGPVRTHGSHGRITACSTHHQQARHSHPQEPIN